MIRHAKPRVSYLDPGDARTPPEHAPCSSCGGPVSRYNPHDRCYSCIRSEGPAPARMEGHAEHCQCLLVREPHPSRPGRYLLPVTCPECDRHRLVTFKREYCDAAYVWTCYECSRGEIPDAPELDLRSAVGAET